MRSIGCFGSPCGCHGDIETGGVNIRTRDGELVGDMSVDDAIAKFEALVAEYK